VGAGILGMRVRDGLGGLTGSGNSNKDTVPTILRIVAQVQSNLHANLR
jgi:hypothetical protein